jgi:IS30 family transposase
MYMRYTHFSKTERLELSVLLKRGYSLREIGSALKKNPSSVSREMNANGGRVRYDPHRAQTRARTKRQDSKYQGMKVREHPELEAYVIEKLQAGWAPDVIAGRWKQERAIPVTITAKGIYKYLYSPYGQRWCIFLKSGQYRSKPHKEKTEKVLIPNRMFITERPRVTTERRRYGDFEGDTLGVPKYTRATIAAAV